MAEKVVFTIFGDPVPFARAGSAGKRRFTPTKQRDYMLLARSLARQAMQSRGIPIFDGVLIGEFEAIYEYPKSWSAKKRAALYWKESRPDSDNLAKAIMDSVGDNDSLASYDKAPGPVIYGDDAQIAWLVTKKHYGPQAMVRVTIERLSHDRR